MLYLLFYVLYTHEQTLAAPVFSRKSLALTRALRCDL